MVAAGFGRPAGTDQFRRQTPLAAIAATRSDELRFLGEAFERLSREYPSTRDGLSLTERRILGDTWCFAMMDRLARAAHPQRHRPVDRRVHLHGHDVPWRWDDATEALRSR